MAVLTSYTLSSRPWFARMRSALRPAIPAKTCVRSTMLLFEWFAAGVMTVMGLHVLVWRESLFNSRFRPMLDTVTPDQVMVALIVVGCTRLYTVWTAGTWRPWCARIRWVTGAIACLFWGQVAAALLVGPPVPSPGGWMFLGACLCEGVVAFRTRRELNAGAD